MIPKRVLKRLKKHDVLSLEDDWVLEAFESSKVSPMVIIGDMMYIYYEKYDILIWASVRMEVIEYSNDEITNEKTITVEAVPEQFSAERKVLPVSILEKRTFSEVLKYGYVYDEMYLNDLISYMQMSAANAPHLIRYNQIGWKEKVVKTKNGTKTIDVFRTNKLIKSGAMKSDGLKYKYVGKVNFDSEEVVENYIIELNALLTTRGLQFSIVAGLSSVILARMNMISAIGTIIIHIYGDSSRGKTTFLKTACSCWGNPNKTPLVSSWNATSNAILTSLVGNYGVTVGLDEASTISYDMSKTIYAIANGVDKSRATKDLSLVENGTWCTTVVSTAEESLLSRSKNNNGLKIRDLEFFNLDITESAEHAEKVNNFVQNSYGILGERFAKVIVDRSRMCLDRFVQKARTYIKRHITETCNLTERLTMAYAVLLATASLAKRYLKLNIDVNNIRDILLEHHNEILKEADPAAKLYECILNYISANRTKFPSDKARYDYNTCIEGVEDNGYYYISTLVFKKIMEANGFSDEKVSVNQLANKGFLNKNKDRNYFNKTMKGITLKCYKIVLKQGGKLE